LIEAVEVGRKWEDEDTPFPTITLEENSYYRSYGYGKTVWKYNSHKE